LSHLVASEGDMRLRRAGMSSAACVVVVLVLLGACGSSGSAKSDTGASTTAGSTGSRAVSAFGVKGTWVNPQPAIDTGAKIIGGRSRLTQRSATIWRGDLHGATTFSSAFNVDPAHQGGFIGDIEEVFTGTVRGVGAGRLHFTEKLIYSVTTGAVDIRATVTRGEGALLGMTGHLHFTGTSAASGVGHGIYDGSLTPQA
jgi:hypothetical protein